jgi:hypothetical protein
MRSSSQYHIQTVFYNPTVTEPKMFKIIKLNWVMAWILVSFWLDHVLVGFVVAVGSSFHILILPATW